VPIAGGVVIRVPTRQLLLSPASPGEGRMALDKWKRRFSVQGSVSKCAKFRTRRDRSGALERHQVQRRPVRSPGSRAGAPVRGRREKS